LLRDQMAIAARCPPGLTLSRIFPFSIDMGMMILRKLRGEIDRVDSAVRM
jgi:hypothetical protein